MLTDRTLFIEWAQAKRQVELQRHLDQDNIKDFLYFARAIEKLVRKATLEEAAKVCDPYTHGQWFAKEIRKLKGEQP